MLFECCCRDWKEDTYRASAVPVYTGNLCTKLQISSWTCTRTHAIKWRKPVCLVLIYQFLEFRCENVALDIYNVWGGNREWKLEGIFPGGRINRGKKKKQKL